MKKTKIAFEDIKAGDLLEVTVGDSGVKQVMTGIAYKLEILWDGDERTHVYWATVEGGMIVNDEENAAIVRLDVSESKFEDIRKGNLVRVTRTEGDVTKTFWGVAAYLSEGTSNDYWTTADGRVIVYRLRMSNETIEIESGE